jgi:hypothetical protein
MRERNSMRGFEVERRSRVSSPPIEGLLLAARCRSFSASVDFVSGGSKGTPAVDWCHAWRSAWSTISCLGTNAFTSILQASSWRCESESMTDRNDLNPDIVKLVATHLAAETLKTEAPATRERQAPWQGTGASQDSESIYSENRQTRQIR